MTEADHIEIFTERAGIRQYDGELPRPQAELAAYWDWRAIVGPKVSAPQYIQECFLNAKRMEAERGQDV